MRTFFPRPNELRIMTTAAALVDWQLLARAETRAVLTAAGLGLRPGRAMEAAAHPDI